MGLPDTDPAVVAHEMLCKILETMAVYDQLNTSELASAELVCRQIQLTEEKCYEERQDKLESAKPKAKAAPSAFTRSEMDSSLEHQKLRRIYVFAPLLLLGSLASSRSRQL